MDGLLLGGIEPFTARHLRRLWLHSPRITHFLGNESGALDHRAEILDLIRAVLDRDPAGIAAARGALISGREAFFLRQLRRSNAPLTPGSRVLGRRNSAAAHRREA